MSDADVEAAKQSKSKQKAKFAFITGINGQDGSYLSELLLSKGYSVHGIIRRCSHSNTGNIEHLLTADNIAGGLFTLRYGDVTDLSALQRSLFAVRSSMVAANCSLLELYHLAAQSHVGVSFKVPVHTLACNAMGTQCVLEAVRTVFPQTQSVAVPQSVAAGEAIDVRIYFAATSELFGRVQETPQRMTTPFCPQSPYAVSKLFGYWLMRNYREAYGMHICNGVLFNHESPRRGKEFVTRKITSELGRVLRGEAECIKLGNLNSKRDWSHSQDMVRAMWLILQQPTPRDWVLGSGEMYSVRQFCEIACSMVGRDLEWSGQGEDEVGRCRNTKQVVVRVDASFLRPSEVELLVADTAELSCQLGWHREHSFGDLVRSMVTHDCRGHVVGDEQMAPLLRSLGTLRSTSGHVVLVTGGSGLVGQAIAAVVKRERESGGMMRNNEGAELQFVFLNSSDGDLRDGSKVRTIFWKFQPEYVIHLAANVGGLYKNLNENLAMFHDNADMNRNVLRLSHQHGVRRVLSCLSTCIFPDAATYPIREDDLHKGSPHRSNLGYSTAKRLLQIESELYRSAGSDQTNKRCVDFRCVTPTNVFGPHDNFHLANGHVLPALIHRCHRAKQSGTNMICKGSGQPKRQFIYSKDLANLILSLLLKQKWCGGNDPNDHDTDHHNVTLAPNHEITIKHAAKQIAQQMDLEPHRIQWDSTKQDGQMKKTASNERLMTLFPDWKFTPFETAIAETVSWFKAHYPDVRGAESAEAEDEDEEKQQ